MNNALKIAYLYYISVWLPDKVKWNVNRRYRSICRPHGPSKASSWEITLGRRPLREERVVMYRFLLKASGSVLLCLDDSYIGISRLLYLLHYSKLEEICYWFDKIENMNWFNVKYSPSGGGSVTLHEPTPVMTTSNPADLLPPGNEQVYEGFPVTLNWNYNLTTGLSLGVKIQQWWYSKCHSR